MLISSPGGHVESGDAIHDMIRFVRAPVTTVGSGWSSQRRRASSSRRRRAPRLRNTRFMIHQPAGGGGQSTSHRHPGQRSCARARRIARVIATQTGRPYDTVVSDMERDFWMSAGGDQYSIASRIVERQSELG